MEREAAVALLQKLVDDCMNAMGEGGIQHACSRSTTALRSILGPDHIHTRRATEIATETQVILLKDPQEGCYSFRTDMLAGVLSAAAADIQDGLIDLDAMHRLQTHEDLLGIARELLATVESSPIAAAMIAGAVMENHLRRMCRTRELHAESKGLSAMNSALKSKGVYPKPQWSQLEAWIHVRNAAVHHDEVGFQAVLVPGMVDGLDGFIRRYPA